MPSNRQSSLSEVAPKLHAARTQPHSNIGREFGMRFFFKNSLQKFAFEVALPAKNYFHSREKNISVHVAQSLADRF
jgi:hypothetical protein